jgi:hypothetical protein
MISVIPESAKGAIIASIVAAIIGLFGLIIAKENKVSEFRQAWIDALRADIASLIAYLSFIRGVSYAEIETKKDRFEASQKLFISVNQAASSIRMRLNPSEKESKIILDKINELEVLMDVGTNIDVVACKICEAELVAISNVFLKKEWKRVRRGEVLYIISIILAFIIAFALILVMLQSTPTLGVAGK